MDLKRSGLIIHIMALSKKTLLQDGDINKDQEELVFDPYNPNNHEITTAQVSEILKKYGVPDKVHNFKLYARAFIHRSYVKRPHTSNTQIAELILRSDE